MVVIDHVGNITAQAIRGNSSDVLRRREARNSGQHGTQLATFPSHPFGRSSKKVERKGPSAYYVAANVNED
jgi:hypothetical protein